MNKDATTATALLITREPHPDALRRALLDAGYQSIVIVATIDSAARWHRESRRLDVIPHAASPCGDFVTVSVGFASLTRVDSTPELLLAAADTALLRAKAAGRNRVSGDAGPIGLPALLATTRDVAHRVLLSARAGELDGAVPLARRLKTAAIEYGLDHVRLLASHLEHAARASDASSIAVVAAEVVEYVDQVQVVDRRADESEPCD